ncbi:MAG: nucleotidyltransferase domain-containing protein, partial [Gammaproteobacteria bacterium]|nr:nucleotidyltransferase domain-containing protein [Gammaproteobacteria bacterium]
MNAKISEILFKESRRKVLSLLLLHPAKSFHVREIARSTGTVAGTINRELHTLAEAELLIRETQGNQLHYRANTDCVIFDELASILKKTSGIADVLAKALLPLSKSIQAAFVYGSMANGRSKSGSDIDLCIIGDVEYLETVRALSDAQRMLQREINPKIYSAGE